MGGVRQPISTLPRCFLVALTGWMKDSPLASHTASLRDYSTRTEKGNRLTRHYMDISGGKASWQPRVHMPIRLSKQVAFANSTSSLSGRLAFGSLSWLYHSPYM